MRLVATVARFGCSCALACTLATAPTFAQGSIFHQQGPGQPVGGKPTGAGRGGPLAQAVRPSASKGFVWTIEREGQKGWLMGSLHMLAPDAYPLPASLEGAFQEAEVLVEEADPDELRAPEAAAELLRRAFFPPGQSLEKHLSPETYRMIAVRAAKAGLPAEAVQRMRPWMVAVTLSAIEIQMGGYDPALGLDKHFRDRALAMGKPVRTLEKAMEQIGFLESLGPSLQESLVAETLKGVDAEVSQIDAMTAAWKAGDAAGMERLLIGQVAQSPDVHRVIFLDRNARWIPKIEACLVTSRCLVVVGAGHLVGEGGLMDLLRKRGYRVEQR
jgi:uncharacterized protein YbaP (TraB family)